MIFPGSIGTSALECDRKMDEESKIKAIQAVVDIAIDCDRLK